MIFLLNDDSMPNRAIISGTNGYIDINPTFYAPTSFRVCTNNGSTAEYPNEYGLELEKCVKNNAIESNIFPHTEMLQVMGLMDEIRSIIGLEFKHYYHQVIITLPCPEFDPVALELSCRSLHLHQFHLFPRYHRHRHRQSIHLQHRPKSFHHYFSSLSIAELLPPVRTPNLENFFLHYILSHHQKTRRRRRRHRRPQVQILIRQIYHFANLHNQFAHCLMRYHFELLLSY